ncbi:hypothetical protein QLX08_005274 [Tetragonisca angustula]|uniref:Uncharacterized protein n=1 Tax=Tetragonisca angustula TaxID=166442 RepID=A0AAW1A0W1_9HYME
MFLRTRFSPQPYSPTRPSTLQTSRRFKDEGRVGVRRNCENKKQQETSVASDIVREGDSSRRWQANNPRDCRGFSGSSIRVDARAGSSATDQSPLFLPSVAVQSGSGLHFHATISYGGYRRQCRPSWLVSAGKRKKKKTLVEIAVMASTAESCLDGEEETTSTEKEEEEEEGEEEEEEEENG